MNFIDHIIENGKDILKSKEVYQESFRIAMTAVAYKKMQNKGLSIDKLADLMSVRLSEVRYWLSGDCNITLDKLAEILWTIEHCEKLLQINP